MNTSVKQEAGFDEITWDASFNSSVGLYAEAIIRSFKDLSESDSDIGESGKELLARIRACNLKTSQQVQPNEIPFDIPTNWVWCRLGEIIEFSANLNIERTLSEDTVINYVDIDAIDNKNYCIREVKQKTLRELSSRARRVLSKGSILYSLVRPYLNNIAIVDEDRDNFIGSTGFAVFKGILVNAQYIKFWLLSPFIREYFLGLMSGFNSPSITNAQFVETLFPLPPVEIQDRIVMFLEQIRLNRIAKNGHLLDGKISDRIYRLQQVQKSGLELNGEISLQVELVGQLRQAFLREAMQGKLVPQDPNDEPASVLLEKIKAEKAILIAEKKIRKGKIQEPEKDQVLDDLPTSWTWCLLDELCIYITDGTHQTPTYTQSGRVFLSAQNVKPFRFMPEQHKFVSEAAYEDYRRNREAEKGDLLVARVGAGIGETAVIDQEIDFCFYVSLGLVKPFKDFVSSKYLAIVFNSPSGVSYAKGNISSKGGSAGNFNLGRIRSFMIPLPPLAEQRRIVEKLETLMAYCDELEANIRESKQYAETLLQVALKEALEPRNDI